MVKSPCCANIYWRDWISWNIIWHLSFTTKRKAQASIRLVIVQRGSLCYFLSEHFLSEGLLSFQACWIIFPTKFYFIQTKHSLMFCTAVDLSKLLKCSVKDPWVFCKLKIAGQPENFVKCFKKLFFRTPLLATSVCFCFCILKYFLRMRKFYLRYLSYLWILVVPSLTPGQRAVKGLVFKKLIHIVQ